MEMMRQSKIPKVGTVVVLMAAFLTVQNAEACSPRAREATAVIQTINYDKRALSLKYPHGRGPREWRFVSSTKPKEGGV